MQQSETTKGLTAYRLQSPSACCLHLHLIILKVHLHPIEDEFQPLSLSLWLTNTCKHTHSSFWLSLLDAYIFPKSKKISNQMPSDETHTPSPLPSFGHSHTQSQQCALHKVVSSGIISRPVICTCKRGCQYIDQTTAQAEINEASSVTITQAEGALGLKADIMCQSSAKWSQQILFKKLPSEGGKTAVLHNFYIPSRGFDGKSLL